jgi:hypothetical protein
VSETEELRNLAKCSVLNGTQRTFRRVGSRWLWGRSWNWRADQSACRSSVELQRPIGLASAGGSRVWVGPAGSSPSSCAQTLHLESSDMESSPSVCDCLRPPFPSIRNSGCRQLDASATIHFSIFKLQSLRTSFLRLDSSSFLSPITSRLTVSHAGTHVPANQLSHHPHPASWSWFRMQPLPGVPRRRWRMHVWVWAAAEKGEATIRSLLIIHRSSLHRSAVCFRAKE